YFPEADVLTDCSLGDQTLPRQDRGSLSGALNIASDRWTILRGHLVALQEELDWACYVLFGLIHDDLMAPIPPPSLQPSERAFEIQLARELIEGSDTTWFDRHGCRPITELPSEWPEEYRRLVSRRLETINNDGNISLIEQPEYKLRRNTEPWQSQLKRALQE